MSQFQSVPKRVLSIAAISTVVVGTALALPAAASAVAVSAPSGFVGVTIASDTDPYIIDIDCNLVDSPDYQNMGLGNSQTLTVRTVNCDDYYLGSSYSDLVADFPPGITPQGGSFISGVDVDGDDMEYFRAAPASEFDVNPNTYVEVYDNDRDEYFGFYVNPAPVIDNPSGTLGLTADVTLSGSDVLEFAAAEPLAPGEPDYVWLGGDETCEMERGAHAYSTTSVDISLDGEYAFRLVNTAPLTSDLQFWQPENSMGDPFLALYEGEGFNPLDPSANVVGCNDDMNDVEAVDSYAYETQSGQIIGGRYPQFTADLEPGRYTLVYTQYGVQTASDWEAAGIESVGTFEMWGPEGGFAALPTDDRELAATGVNASLPLTAGLLLMVAGGGLFLARRRLA